jgi:hypothetical protein
MTIEELRKVHRAAPFRPFTIYLTDGRSFLVPRREFFSHSPSGRTVIVATPDDAFEIIDLLLVSNLKVHPVTAASDE